MKISQLARMNLDWKNIPESNLHLSFSDLTFEDDLDMTGKRSLHQLIDISISNEGSQRLASWLLQNKPDFTSIQKRQKIIKELIPLSRFRNKLLLTFRLVSNVQLDGHRLIKWLRAEFPSLKIKKLLAISTGFVTLNLALFLGTQFLGIRPYWIFSLFFYFIFYLYNFKILQNYFDMIFHFDDELTKFRQVLRYLESYPYQKNEHLKELCRPFLDPKFAPSKRLRKIKLVTAAVGMRMNPIIAILLNLILPWDFYFARLIHHYRDEMKIILPQWVDTWAELEALIAISNFAYLNPDYCFPDIINLEPGNLESPLVEARNMGHPLIPADQKICNDFSINNRGEVYLITGSNMSGKSTFLKTVGVNLCLAYAGGTVDAAHLRTSLFRIFTSIKINDSIVDGFSFFYAEVKRLRTLLDALQDDLQYPVLFLIDEIFRGTNNRERLIGSRSYIRHLVSQNGLGLIATHDLELTKLADQFSNITNFHFREEVVAGRMVFDYKLHPGPCPTTNALKIMMMEGLPVQLED
jgi:DNA mismatch repair ATPase MutS